MKIKSIKEIPIETVYAVQTTTGTFIADGLAHHNCYHCNVNLSGNWPEYRARMIAKYGEEHVTTLEERRHEIVKEFDYEAEIQKYKDVCAEMGITVR